jgi:hypothetical protein
MCFNWIGFQNPTANDFKELLSAHPGVFHQVSNPIFWSNSFQNIFFDELEEKN